MIIPVFHVMLLVFPVLYVLFKGSPKYYDLILAYFIFISMHWSFFKNECILSYLKKKYDDCSYKLGDTHLATDLKFFNSYIHVRIFDIIKISVGLYLSIKLNYNTPLYVFAHILAIIPDPSKIIKIIVNLSYIYFLKDNQYLVPGIILILGSSMIVKHKDKNSCIVGSQVPEEELEFKPLK
jgi:hypothetical protein